MIIIKSDTLTPMLNDINKKIKEKTGEIIKRSLLFGKGRAKYYARGKGKSGRTGDLEKGIGHRFFKESNNGYIFSIAKGRTTGFPYNKWVNKDIVISGEYPYFENKNNIKYGQGGIKSPSGKPIIWSVYTKKGFFTQAFLDMETAFNKKLKKLKLELLK